MTRVNNHPDYTKELEQIMEEHHIGHLQVGRFFFIPAYEEVPACVTCARVGDYPVIPFQDRDDLPTKLKNAKYQSHIIHFYGLGNPLGPDYSEGNRFCHSPSTETGLLALQQLDLEGKTVLDAGCRLGEHTILPAKIGARVIGISRSVEITEKNVQLNNVADRVQLMAANLLDVDYTRLGEISVVITNGGPTSHLAQALKTAKVFISCEPKLDESILIRNGYSNFVYIHYGSAVAVIGRR